jgi:hypothetical protein
VGHARGQRSVRYHAGATGVNRRTSHQTVATVSHEGGIRHRHPSSHGIVLQDKINGERFKVRFELSVV